MGTRGLTVVINKAGETKVAQYGQWDHYPDGQGKTILDFLRNCDLKKFNDKLNEIHWITPEEAEEVNKVEDWHLKYPHLSRDVGGKILNAIQYGEVTLSDYPRPDKVVKVNVEYLGDSLSFAGDSLFCEWAYVIDLKKGTFEVFKGFNKTPLTKKDRFFNITSDKDSDYYQVKLVKKYSLKKLPTIKEFLKDFKSEEE